MKLLYFQTLSAKPAFLWRLLGAYIAVSVTSPVAQAQPADAPEVPAPATLSDIHRAVAALVEATQSDEGYLSAQEVVTGVSKDASLLQAWRAWRLAALSSNSVTLDTRLMLQDVEVETFKRQRDAGGAASAAATAHVRVHLSVASGPPTQPVEGWPADPWQGEFTLIKVDAKNAPWQFVASQEEAVGDNGTTPDSDAFIEVPERGGNRLEQAIQVLRHPVAMLRTALLRTDNQSLSLLVNAVGRYVSKIGHYPPADYAAALLGNEPQESQPILRAAFIVTGTTRTWQFNPALYERPIVIAPAPQETKVPQKEVALFWDGTAQKPSFRFAGQTLIAFVDGRVELRRAQDLPPDLQIVSPQPAVSVQPSTSPRKE